MISKGRFGHGLIGYGIPMYQPFCASACRDSIKSATLNCTPAVSGTHGEHSMAITEPKCYATDESFLTTLAYCVSQHCSSTSLWKVERWWKANVAGNADIQPEPKWSYQQTLLRITTPPTANYNKKAPLNTTTLIPNSTWFTNFNADSEFETLEITSENFGLIIVLSGVLVPIVFSLARFLPFPSLWRSKVSALIVDPPLFGSKHSQPVFWNLLILPTRGQAFFIAYLTILNLVLSSVDIWTKQPNSWYESTNEAITTYIANRTGVLSFINLVLAFLYAGRNNFLLWITNWSHLTFIIAHRYIALISTLQAIIHSVLYLVLKVQAGTHTSESKLSYWIWGAAATVAMTILLHTSIHPIRQRCYELFLANHIVLSIIVVIGSYYHILLRFQHQWGYEVWMWAVMAVWGFDHIVRWIRLARHGIRTAQVTILDEDYVRVNVPGVAGSGHAYLYFPTLTWRFWENHPFSVASTLLPTPDQTTPMIDSSEYTDMEKKGGRLQAQLVSGSDSESHRSQSYKGHDASLTFLIRTQTGLTRHLHQRTNLPILIEGNYGSDTDVTQYSTLIAIAGGVGITALLPLIRAHSGRTKLYWGARSSALIRDFEVSLEGIDKDIILGQRMDIALVLENELRDEKGEVCVVCSGPNSMTDEVRTVVTRLVWKKNLKIKLIVEAFSW
ncbi:ferric reductase-like protein transmembrane component 4 [Microthyrium microscopicum]|uniref:Ferric reductase-like protein transmembrane component 4 n=1 Tax=Microthyrium microscopicum TaxID=703497 RepID=A0A6A6UTT2_9PEZI|nr:ferric reductase-like protein transmembrane component 4 [Microthyrium microscopicum]